MVSNDKGSIGRGLQMEWKTRQTANGKGNEYGAITCGKKILNHHFMFSTVLIGIVFLFICEGPALGFSDKPIMRLGRGYISGNVIYSLDGKYIAVGTSIGIELLDASSLEIVKLFEGHTNYVISVSFSPDGRTLASGSDDTIKLWDVATGKEIATLKGHTDYVYSVSFSPDGRMLASGSWDHTIKLWDVATFKEIATLKGHTSEVSSVSFSPDGRMLASGSRDHTIKLWDVATFKEIATLKGHTSEVSSVSFSPDGRMLASGSWDHTIKLWDVATFKEIATLKGHTSSVESVSFSPDGKTLASGSDDYTIKLWDVATGKEIATLKGHTRYVMSISFSPDGRTLASGSEDKNIKLWDVATGKEIATLKGHTSYVESVSFSPDGRTLASGSADNTIKLWDIATGKEIATLKGHTDGVSSVSFSPDGRTLASGSDDSTFKLWDVATGKEIAAIKGHTHGVSSISFSPDGRTLASGSGDYTNTIKDNTIKLWNVATGKEITTLKGHTYGVSSISFSPDGRTLASGSVDDTIKLWDIATGKEIATLKGHTDYVNSVSFSPDGRTLASGSSDGTILIWDISVAPRSNIAPLLSNGIVTPLTGEKNTEFTFKVTYTDADDDIPFSITVKIDDDTPKEMIPVDEKDTNYADGKEYQYVTKLSPGEHKYSFTASDWKSDATGDTTPHTGPTVTNRAPALSSGSVTPETGHRNTEFVFKVTYTDADGDAPSGVTVKIDEGEQVKMERKDGQDYTKGVVYVYRANLKQGKHSYVFSSSDGMSNATGDIAIHSGPLVVENTAPMLSNGSLSPQTGTKITEFRFAVIYSDRDNDQPSAITITIDGNPPQSMSVVNQLDNDYTDGVVYEYKTKLNVGAHTYTFSAKDWSADATGDTLSHSGPTVTVSNSPSVLSNGSVMPQIGMPETEFTFMVLYTSPDNEPPSEITVKIDGELKKMVPPDKGTIDYTKGVTYQYKTKMALGTHTYAFSAKSGEKTAVGDTVSHSGPLVSDIFILSPGSWNGSTSQKNTVSFTVSVDGKSITDFRMSVDTYLQITVTVDGRTETESHWGTISGTIPQMSISGKSFSGSITNEVSLETLDGTRKGTATARISGTFTSPTTVEGTFSGIYPETVIRKPPPGGLFPWVQQLTLMGSGSLNASVPSSIVIKEPNDGALLNLSTVKISGVAAGPLVNSAEVNGKPVQIADGSFSTIMPLVEGMNSINLTAFDSSKNIVGTYSIQVTSDITPPVVTITEPKNGLITENGKIIVKGTIDDPSILYVDVNGVPVCVSNGQFTTTTSLTGGVNLITANTTDKAGNVGKAEISVTFKPSTPWDVNRDGIVDILDLTLVAQHFGESPPKDAKADVNDDGRVDILDLVLVGKHFGEKTSSTPPATPPRIIASESTAVWLKTERLEPNTQSQLLYISVMANDTKDLYGFQFDLVFPTEALEVVSVSEGELLRKGTNSTYWQPPQINNRTGKITNTAGVRIATATGINEGGVLATITFRLKSTNLFPSGELILENTKLINSRGVQFSVLQKVFPLEGFIIPARPELCQNYPNPFNPDTWIPYKLAEQGKVTIRIYNQTGQLVRQLDLGYKEAGIYLSKERAAHWDGQNEMGEYVSSGIYFYQLQTGKFSTTKKFVMLK